jgi:hypothetical protein
MKRMNQFLFRSGRLLIHRTLIPRALMLSALLLAAEMPGHLAAAQDLRDQRSVHRSFPASLETTLEVENKYGKIQLLTWEEDSISVEVDMILTESKASKLRKLKEDIKIDFTGTKSYVIARTVIASESGRLASELKSISNTISGTNKRIEINYLIRVPEYLDVVLSNKFGDIYMDDLEGQVDITLSNGMLKANRLAGNSSLDLSFADGMINSMGSATVKLSYSELELNQVSQLDLVSKSSRLTVDSVNVVKIDSRRDKLNFQKAEYLYGKSNFTQVRIYDFLRESDVYMKYGKLTIEHVMPAFTRIYVESDYTDVSLFFDEDASLEFDILHHDKSTLRLPGNVSADESLNGKDHYTSVGTMGSGEPRGKVKIDGLQKCYINLSYK